MAGELVGAGGMAILFVASAPGIGCWAAGFDAGGVVPSGCFCPQPLNIINAKADTAGCKILFFMIFDWLWLTERQRDRRPHINRCYRVEICLARLDSDLHQQSGGKPDV